jgi:hypothetical protein
MKFIRYLKGTRAPIPGFGLYLGLIWEIRGVVRYYLLVMLNYEMRAIP